MKRNHPLMILAICVSFVMLMGAFSPTTVVFADETKADPPMEMPQPPDTIDAMNPPSGDYQDAAAAGSTEIISVLDLLNLLLIVT